MKYIYYRILFVFLTVLSLTACTKDLDRYPTNENTNKDVYSTALGTYQALAKVYGAWALTEGDVAGMDDGSTGFVRNLWNLQVLTTDEGICAWTDVGVPDMHNLSWSSSNQFVAGLYYRSIIQIKFANEFLQNIASSVVSDAEKAQMRAEVRFIRAYQYWVLMDLFGNPPFITEEDKTGKYEPRQIQRAELFKYVESELLDIVKDLAPARKAGYGRADQAAAYALLARLYLNAEVYTARARWTEAADYAEKVIQSGYKLLPDYAHLFLADNHLNNEETILSINFDGKQSQSWSGATFLVYSAYNDDIVTKLKEKGINIGISGGGWGGNRATPAFGKLFDKDRDSRALLVYTSDQIESPGKFIEGVHVYKYRNVTSEGKNGGDNTHADPDFPLFRLSEMYLIYAEAALRSGEHASKALNYFNIVRRRAYKGKDGDLTSLTLRDILDERGRELYWEGHRRTDLIRFGLFVSDKYLWDWKGGTPGGRAVGEYRRLFPIPAADILANPKNLKQNPQY